LSKFFVRGLLSFEKSNFKKALDLIHQIFINAFFSKVDVTEVFRYNARFFKYKLDVVLWNIYYNCMFSNSNDFLVDFFLFLQRIIITGRMIRIYRRVDIMSNKF